MSAMPDTAICDDCREPVPTGRVVTVILPDSRDLICACCWPRYAQWMDEERLNLSRRTLTSQDAWSGP